MLCLTAAAPVSNVSDTERDDVGGATVNMWPPLARVTSNVFNNGGILPLRARGCRRVWAWPGGVGSGKATNCLVIMQEREDRLHQTDSDDLTWVHFWC